jgi:hypothetical protein
MRRRICWQTASFQVKIVVAGLRIRITLMRIRIQHFTVMRIRVQPFTLMRIRILPPHQIYGRLSKSLKIDTFFGDKCIDP